MPFGSPYGHILLDDAAFAQCRKIISRLPAARIGLHAQIIEPFLECFEMRVAVAVIVEADGVEIPKAAIDRQITTPVILVSLECDAFAGLHCADGVGAAAQQGSKLVSSNVAGINRVLCQHGHQTDDKWKFAIVGAGQIKTHSALVSRLRFVGLDVVSAEIRPASIAQQLPGKYHVVGRAQACRRKNARRD